MKITDVRKITLDDGSKHECYVTIDYEGAALASIYESAFSSDWIRYQSNLRKLTNAEVSKMIREGGGLHVHASEVNKSVKTPEEIKSAALNQARMMTPEARKAYIAELQAMK